jgi:hypothetical protein
MTGTSLSGCRTFTVKHAYTGTLMGLDNSGRIYMHAHGPCMCDLMPEESALPRVFASTFEHGLLRKMYSVF